MSRINNINDHITDSAKAVKFNPENTSFPEDITNVQDALNEIGEYALKGKMPVATETQQGIIQLATLEEAREGLDKNKSITPFTLNDIVTKPHATETIYGTTRYSTEIESMDIDQFETTITPKRLHYVLDTRNATESLKGTLRISTNAQAVAGTDDESAMTPLKVNQAIQALVPRQATASETIEGTVKLATTAQMQAGTLNIGVAVSPKAFAQTNATTAYNGTVKLATPAQVLAGTDNTTAISPSALHSSKGSISGYGIVKLTTTYGAGDNNTALAFNANVVPNYRTVNGKPLTGNISISAADVGTLTTGQINSSVNSLQSQINSIRNTWGGWTNGWWRCASTGLIIQWGRLTASNGYQSYPIGFPNMVFSVNVTTTGRAYGGAEGHDYLGAFDNYGFSYDVEPNPRNRSPFGFFFAIGI